MSDLNVALILKLVDKVTGPLRKLDGSIRGALERSGAAMRRLGGAMSLAVTAPLGVAGAGIVRTAGDFEAAMNRVAAISGATGEELGMLSDAARRMGAATKFRASEAADALGFLAMAGFGAREAVDALPGVLSLAAASGVDLASSADIASNVLSGYGMEVADLGRVNDVLVKTFTSANTNLQQLGDAMSYAGPVARGAGLDFEEVSAAIGLLGDAGIQGSRAGTALLGAINKMANPSKEQAKLMAELGVAFTDAEGRMLPLADVLEQLGPHAENAGALLRLFGTEAGPGMMALARRGAGALRELTAELEAAGGAADRVASRQAKGFNASLAELSSAFEELQLSIAESGLLDFVTQLVAKVTDIVRVVGEADPRILKFGTVIAGIAAVVGPALAALGLVAGAIAAIGAPVILVGAAIGGFVALMVAAFPEIQAAWGGVTRWFRDLWAGVTQSFADAWDYIRPIIDRIVTGAQSLIDLVPSLPSWLGGDGGDAPGIDGARAAGGPVRGGGAYLVGEEGPELFRPATSGAVVPAGATAALMGGGLTVGAITIHAAPGMDPAAIAREVRRHLAEMARAPGALHDRANAGGRGW